MSKQPGPKYHAFSNSSNISEAHYDEHAKQLSVRFKNGQEYSYGGVEKEAWDGMKDAESVGSYFNKQIRLGDYKFAKVEKK